MALLVLMLNVMAEGAIWAFIERIAVADGLTTSFRRDSNGILVFRVRHWLDRGGNNGAALR